MVYYEIDFSTGTVTTPEDITITKTYDYFSEILNLIIRIILTLAMEHQCLLFITQVLRMQD